MRLVARAGVPLLLDRGLVLSHPWVTGELAVGRLSQRHAGAVRSSVVEQTSVVPAAEA